MKKLALSVSALLLALGITGALAQLVTPPQVASVATTDLFQDIPKGVPGSTNVYASGVQLRAWFYSQNSKHLATAPTLTTSTSICGGTGATVSGSDYGGQVAEASSASTSCVITFATPYVTAPECFVSLDNVADTALKCAASTTALTVTQTSASSNKLNYLVIGLAGG